MTTDGSLVGVGVDLAGVDRLMAALQRRAALASRLFTETELVAVAEEQPLQVAQRFAAKEAVMKALGVGIDSVRFTDVEVAGDLGSVRLRGSAADRAAHLGATSVTLEVDATTGPDGEVAVARAEARGRPSRSASVTTRTQRPELRQ
ncbi:MAG: 4'-phosphopantetheinyl transferase superfamily protein [Actinomycetia bacterium]|nr:4'-phosphopantetheinyl transferase superfamily protein [Actinomycetes bacterium]